MSYVTWKHNWLKGLSVPDSFLFMKCVHVFDSLRMD